MARFEQIFEGNDRTAWVVYRPNKVKCWRVSRKGSRPRYGRYRDGFVTTKERAIELAEQWIAEGR